MSSTEKLSINVVEIHHRGPVIQFTYSNPEEYLEGEAIDANGEDHLFRIAAKDIKAWAASCPGITAEVATIELPPIRLDGGSHRAGKPVNLGAVCDTYDLWQETKASGAEGTIFTADDVRSALEDGDEGFNDLDPDEQDAFLQAHWWHFTRKLDDTLSGRGNEYISTMVATEYDERIAEFRRSRTAPSA